LKETSMTLHGNQKVHAPATVDNAPPTRSKVTAGVAALACAACCALPFLIAAGVLTGAGAALTQNILLATTGVLVAVAGLMWWLHRRQNARRSAAAGASGCEDGTCAC
jgi:high-affinity Fe2+/Pb2+ permease